jgi:hypothetical protein
MGGPEVACWGSVRISPSTVRRNDKPGHAFLLQRIRLDLTWLGFLALIGGLLSSLDQICNTLLFPLRQPPASLCSLTNVSYADPSKLEQRRSLRREMHCGTVLPPPAIRSKSAS